MGTPHLLHTVIDTTDVRGSAEFWRELLGLVYRLGDDPPAAGTADDADWLVLTDVDGTRRLAFQEVHTLTPTTWPSTEVPMQLHLDLTVEDRDDLERQRARAEALGGPAAPRPHRRPGRAALRPRRPRRAHVLPARGLSPLLTPVIDTEGSAVESIDGHHRGR